MTGSHSNPNILPQRYISPVRLAEMLDVSTQTIRRWTLKGVLPQPIKMGGMPRYDLRAVQKRLGIEEAASDDEDLDWNDPELYHPDDDDENPKHIQPGTDADRRQFAEFCNKSMNKHWPERKGEDR